MGSDSLDSVIPENLDSNVGSGVGCENTVRLQGSIDRA